MEVDGRLITDGGVVNDFPAREVREKGMDIIIGVNVEAGLYGKDELQSIEKIIDQVISFQMVARSREQVQYCDLIIWPDIGGYSVTSFGDADSLIARGDQAARLQWEQLLDIARQQQARPQPPRVAAVPPRSDNACPMHINTVRLEPNRAITKPALLKKFQPGLPGEISFEQFREGIAALYATGSFQFLDYGFQNDSGGVRDVYIRPRLRPGYDRSLRLSLHFDNVYKSSLLLNLTFRNLLFKNSVTAFDCIIGDKIRYNLHYLADIGRWPAFGFNSRFVRTDLFVDLPVQADVGGAFSLQNLLFNLTNSIQEVYLNLASDNRFATGVAAELQFFKTATDQAVDYRTEKNYINEKGWYSAGKLFFHFDNRDRIFFTQTGTLANVECRVIWPLSSQTLETIPSAKNPGWNIDLRVQRTFPFTERLSGTASLNAGFTFGTPAPPFRYFIGSNNLNLINNFRPFVGLPFAKFSGDNLVQGSLYAQYKLFKNKNHYCTLSGHLAWLDDEWRTVSDGKNLFRSWGLSYGLDTPLGPVELTFGYSNRGSAWHFNLGYWF